MSNRERNTQTLITRYLQGRLAGDELERFEDALMENPALVDETEAMRELGAAFRPPPAAQKTASKGRYFSAVAGFVLALGVTTLLLPAAAPTGAGTVTAELRLEQFRGSNADALPSLAATEGLTLLLIDIGPRANDTYCVSIARDGDDNPMQFSKVPPLAGYLQVTAEALAPGHFSLAAAPGRCGAAPVVRYRFKVEA